ncbi:MAG: hypothetical protein KDB00_22190 [Planctomycetales bacterium]|nr:hypothetical protein [Planctomycetales bacterium]
MSNNKRSSRALIVAVLAAGSVTAGGCMSPATQTDTQVAKFFSVPDWMTKAPWSKSSDKPPTPYPNPVKLASTWTPDVLVQSGKTPTRGFGGRLFFFDEKTKAVPVEGTLTVHGFETNANGEESTIKPFKFTPEQFTQHYSQSDFGASYSIWIPWDAVGGDEKHISLVPTFRTTEGKIVQGSPTKIILPGRKKNKVEDETPTYLSSQYRGHQDAITGHATQPSGLVTTTIRRYGTTTDGQNTLPSPSLQERVNAIVANQRSANIGGTTPFIDVQPSMQGLAGQDASRQTVVAQEMTPATSGVMRASAEMSSQSDGAVRSAGSPVSAPRRIKSLGQ